MGTTLNPGGHEIGYLGFHLYEQAMGAAIDLIRWGYDGVAVAGLLNSLGHDLPLRWEAFAPDPLHALLRMPDVGGSMTAEEVEAALPRLKAVIESGKLDGRPLEHAKKIVVTMAKAAVAKVPFTVE